MLKIWEKWELNPDKRDLGLEHFIKDSHPAIREMRERVNGYVQSILYGIKLLDKEERKKLIEQEVNDSWKYDHLEEDDKKHQTDRNICSTLWQIYVSNNGTIEVDGETIGFVKWSGKSKFDMDEKDLDADWDLIWEWNQEDQHYGSVELKDWIWNQKYFGLKQSLLPKIQLAQAIIPDELRKDIDARVKIVNEKVDDYASAWIQMEKKNKESGDVKSFMKLDLAGEAPDIEKIYFADDLWKDLDHMGIVKRIEEEEEALKASRRYKKDLGKVILEVSEYGNVQLNFKDDNACQICGWKTLKGMKDGYFVGGGTEYDFGKDNTKPWSEDEDGEIWFTPDWGECKGITEIEDFIKYIGKKRKIKEAFFWCRWLKEESDNFPIEEEIDVKNPENTKESEEKLIKEHTIERYWARHSMYEKHSYFHLKGNDVEEIVDRDLPHKGILSGGDNEDLAFAYAISNGKKEWEYEGKKWNEDSYLRDRNPEDYEEEEEE